MQGVAENPTMAPNGETMMDSFEFTKVAAAVLCALLLIFGAKTALEIAGVGRYHEVAGGFTLPAATAETAAPADAGAATPAAFDPAAVVAMIKTAKPEDAAGNFKKCAGCHSYDKASASKAGPNLWNVLGRKKGTREDFSGYSEAMKSKGGEWSYADLAQFIHSPKTYVPGTKMLFNGVADSADLANLIAYIRTLSDSPAPLP
jgi:cytochrome c